MVAQLTGTGAIAGFAFVTMGVLFFAMKMVGF